MGCVQSREDAPPGASVPARAHDTGSVDSRAAIKASIDVQPPANGVAELVSITEVALRDVSGDVRPSLDKRRPSDQLTRSSIGEYSGSRLSSAAAASPPVDPRASRQSLARTSTAAAPLDLAASGVSLRYFRRFFRENAATKPDITTREVVEMFVRPATADGEVRFASLVPPEDIWAPGKGTMYLIVHAWDAQFSTLVNRLNERFHKDTDSKVFLWLDLFAVNPWHPSECAPTPRRPGPRAPKGASAPPAYRACARLRRSGRAGARLGAPLVPLTPRSIAHRPSRRDLLEKDALSWAVQLSTSTLVVLDNKAIPFTRLWCLYEIALADHSGRGLELLCHNKDMAAMRLFEMDLSRAAISCDEARPAIIKRLIPNGESLHEVSNTLRASLNKRLLGGGHSTPSHTPPPPQKRFSAPVVRPRPRAPLARATRGCGRAISAKGKLRGSASPTHYGRRFPTTQPAARATRAGPSRSRPPPASRTWVLPRVAAPLSTSPRRLISTASSAERQRRALDPTPRRRPTGGRHRSACSDDVPEATAAHLRLSCRATEQRPLTARRLPAGSSQVLEDHYAIGRQLGKGVFGVVYECTDLDTGDVFCVKSISKNNLKCGESPPPSGSSAQGSRMRCWLPASSLFWEVLDARFRARRSQEMIDGVRREVQIMLHLQGHTNIVEIRARRFNSPLALPAPSAGGFRRRPRARLGLALTCTFAPLPWPRAAQGVYETPRNLYIVMEICGGGELFSSISKMARPSPPFVCRLGLLCGGSATRGEAAGCGGGGRRWAGESATDLTGGSRRNSARRAASRSARRRTSSRRCSARSSTATVRSHPVAAGAPARCVDVPAASLSLTACAVPRPPLVQTWGSSTATSSRRISCSRTSRTTPS